MKESSVLHRKITPASLAKMNLSRQKAKSTLTILSLSLGGVLVVLISTMLVSYDGVAEARGRAFPVGEFNIQLNANQSWDTAGISLSGLQQKNFLNADFINAVESIDGVTGIKHWYYTDAEYRVNGNSGNGFRAFAEMNSRIWRKSELRERLIMMNWWQAMELSCFKSVPISMILRLRWVIPSKWTIKPNPAKFAQRPIPSWAL